MRKLTIILSFLSFSVLAQTDSTHNIKVTLKGATEGNTMYLAHYFGYNQYIKQDSAKVTNNTLSFNAKTKLPQGMYLLVINASKYYQMVVGDEQHFSIESDTTDFAQNAKVIGSKENELFFSFQRGMKERITEIEAVATKLKIQTDPAAQKINQDKIEQLQKGIDAYRKKIIADNPKSLTANIIKATMDPDIPNTPIIKADGSTDSTAMFYRYRNAFLRNIDFSDDRLLRTPFLHQKIERFIQDLTVQTADSVIKGADYVIGLSKANKDVFRYTVWYMTNQYENAKIVGLEGVFIHLAEKYYISGEAFWADSSAKARFQERVTIMKPLLLEKPFPALNLTDDKDQWKKLEDVKAKYTIVNFYDPDCGHCKESAPKMAEYYKKQDKSRIAIYNVTINPDTDKWKKFIEEYKLQDFINVRDISIGYNYKQRYDAYSTPTTYILDEQKRIIGRKIPLEEMEKYLEFWERRQAQTTQKK